MQKICNKIIVGFVWILIFVLAFGFCGIYLPQLYLKNKIWFFFLTIIFTIIFILLIISYAKATCTQPGSPDNQLTKQYQSKNKLEQLKKITQQRQNKRKQIRRRQGGVLSPANQQQLQQQLEELKTNQYCFKCQIVRPPRAHHCSICKQCILRMDHHCPWTGNCIGLYNHKYFILFLFYATVGLAIISFNILIDWIIGRKVMGDVKQDWKIYFVPVVGIASLLLMISIGFLFFAQMMSAMINITTLESFIDGIQDQSPFDKGHVSENFKDIFGVKGFSLLPTAPIFKFQGDHQYEIQHRF